MNGLVIRQTGTLEQMEYRHILEYLMADYVMVEEKVIDDGRHLCLYADVDSQDDYNRFEFEYRNYRGDVFAILYDYDENKMMDLTQDFFLENYTLLYDIVEDSEYSGTNEYDYDDSFIVDDRF